MPPERQSTALGRESAPVVALIRCPPRPPGRCRCPHPEDHSGLPEREEAPAPPLRPFDGPGDGQRRPHSTTDWHSLPAGSIPARPLRAYPLPSVLLPDLQTG